MAGKHPKYRVSQWIDTSEESMRKPRVTILYGVQTQRLRAGAWMNVAKDGEPMFFDTLDKAAAACRELSNAHQAAAPEVK